MNQKRLSLIALPALAGLFILIVLIQRDPGIELGPYQALGMVAAEEALKLIPEERGQVVLISQDTSQFDMPALEAQLRAFQAAARKSKRMTVALEEIRMDAMTMMATGGRVPADRLLNLLEKHPEAGTAVLFLGFPELTKRELEILQKRGARIVVVAGYRPEYRQLLDDGLIELAIVPRRDAPEPGPAPRTQREWFEREYMIIRP